jgi:hypothetical protein
VCEGVLGGGTKGQWGWATDIRSGATADLKECPAAKDCIQVEGGGVMTLMSGRCA